MCILNHGSIIPHNGHRHCSKLRVSNAGLIGKAGIGKEHVNKSGGRGVEGTKLVNTKGWKSTPLRLAMSWYFYFVSSSEGTSFVGIFEVMEQGRGGAGVDTTNINEYRFGRQGDKEVRLLVAYLRTIVVYVMISLGASLSGSMEAGAEVEEMVEDLIMHCVAASFVCFLLFFS